MAKGKVNSVFDTGYYDVYKQEQIILFCITIILENITSRDVCCNQVGATRLQLIFRC